MNTVHPAKEPPLTQPTLAFDPVALWRRLAIEHRPLAVSGLATLALLALFVVGLALDPRTIAGAPAWLKPTKFAVSISVYTFTLLWLLGHVRQDVGWRAQLVRAAGWVVLVVFIVEWVAILAQVLRGTTSHFNFATPFDAALYSAMGVAINVLMGANVVVAILLLTQRFASAAFGASLRWGMAITVLGMAQASLMTLPTAQQLAGWQAGGPVTLVGAHSVGAPDGVAVDGASASAGLPVVSWRRDAGDLRERQRAGLVHVAGVGYLGLTLLVTWQALRAQPLLSPDVFTWAALWALVLGCALAATVVVWRARGALDEAPDEVAAGALVGLADAANDAAPAGTGLVTSANHPYSSLEVPLRACGDEVDDVAVYDTRVKVGRDSVSVPSLAESNATSLDGPTSTFTLREGVRFHHGTLLAAASDRALMKRP